MRLGCAKLSILRIMFIQRSFNITSLCQPSTFCLFFVLLGVFVRVFLFSQDFDLIPDEARLSASIWHAGFQDIFAGRLTFNQNAPLGFLLTVKILAFFFGSSELILRLLPFIAGILLFPLAYKFAIKEFNEKFACIFLFFLVCSEPLLFYSIQFKQYSVEAFIALFWVYKRERLANWNFILLAMVSILFSSTAPLILAGICISHFILLPKTLKSMIPKLLALAVFSAAYYFLWLNQLEGKNFMNSFWDGFWFPNLNFIQFIGRHFINLTPYITQYEPSVYLYAALTIVLSLLGFYFLFKEHKSIAIIILVTLFSILLMYFLKIYPLGIPLDPILNQTENFAMAQVVGSRLMVYFIPVIFIAISFGLYKILGILNSRYFAISCILLIVLSLSPNIGRMQTGLGAAEYFALLEKTKPYLTEKSVILMSTFNSTVHTYYQRNNLQNEYFSISYMFREAILMEPIQNIEIGKSFVFYEYSDLFSSLKYLGVNRAIFIFANYDSYQMQFLKYLPEYLKQTSYEWLMFPAKDAAAVVVDF